MARAYRKRASRALDCPADCDTVRPMSILELLGLRPRGDDGHPPAPGAVTAIMEQLAQLSDDEARYLACFAYLLARAAYADLEISSDEIAKMRDLLGRVSSLSREQIELVVQIASTQSEQHGGTQNYIVAREFKGQIGRAHV